MQGGGVFLRPPPMSDLLLYLLLFLIFVYFL